MFKPVDGVASPVPFVIDRIAVLTDQDGRHTLKNNWNVDTWGRFHQRSTYSFCARRSQKRKKIQLSHQCLFTLLGSTSVKAVHRMLMKLSRGVNFINIVHEDFTREDPNSIKIQSSCKHLFALLGSTQLKTAHKMLMKLTLELILPNFDFSRFLILS